MDRHSKTRLSLGILTVLLGPLAAPLFPASIDATVKSGDVALAATLITPVGAGPFPAVVLLPGSGPSTRSDVTTMAAQLTTRGWAVLVYDKRGCGASTGNWIATSLSELADDAVAALTFLTRREEVDTRRLGFWGVSQSGWVGPIAAGRTNAAKFLVAVTGGGATPRQVETLNYEHAIERGRLDKDQAAAARKAVDAYFAYLGTGQGLEALEATLAEPSNQPWASAIGLAHVLPSEALRPKWEWVASYDPLADIQRLKIPVLVLLGGRDENSPTDDAFAAWNRGLSGTSDPRSRILMVPGAGHGMTLGGHQMHPTPEGTKYAPGVFDEAIRWELMVHAASETH
ncbi:MAG: alpha/beta fold hydrolase [Acidobacteriota bacterium]